MACVHPRDATIGFIVIDEKCVVFVKSTRGQMEVVASDESHCQLVTSKCSFSPKALYDRMCEAGKCAVKYYTDDIDTIVFVDAYTPVGEVISIADVCTNLACFFPHGTNPRILDAVMTTNIKSHSSGEEGAKVALYNLSLWFDNNF